MHRSLSIIESAKVFGLESYYLSSPLFMEEPILFWNKNQTWDTREYLL